jgi:hypothetical protein
MKKVIKLTESDIERLVQKIIKEGQLQKAVTTKDLDVKMDTFRDKIKKGLKSNCEAKKDGNDFKIYCDGKHVAQVMFRRDAITVKKVGDKKGDEFDFNQYGKIMSKINQCCGEKINEGEEHGSSRYMFFSNLEQIKRQAGLLLDLDEDQVEEILESGHDWAQDHIAEAKNNMDQVFDFLMNETKSGDMWKSVEMGEGGLPYDEDNDMNDIYPTGTSDWRK